MKDYKIGDVVTFLERDKNIRVTGKSVQAHNQLSRRQSGMLSFLSKQGLNVSYSGRLKEK